MRCTILWMPAHYEAISAATEVSGGWPQQRRAAKSTRKLPVPRQGDVVQILEVHASRLAALVYNP